MYENWYGSPYDDLFGFLPYDRAYGQTHRTFQDWNNLDAALNTYESFINMESIMRPYNQYGEKLAREDMELGGS